MPVDAVGCSGMPVDAAGYSGMYVDAVGCSGMSVDAVGCNVMYVDGVECSGMTIDAVGCSICSDARHDDKEKNFSSRCSTWYTDAPNALMLFLFLPLFITTNPKFIHTHGM